MAYSRVRKVRNLLSGLVAGPAPEEEGGELSLEVSDGVIRDGAIVIDE